MDRDGADLVTDQGRTMDLWPLNAGVKAFRKTIPRNRIASDSFTSTSGDNKNAAAGRVTMQKKGSYYFNVNVMSLIVFDGTNCIAA